MKEALLPVESRLRSVKEWTWRSRGTLEAIGNDVKEIYNMLKPLNSELGAKVGNHEMRIAALEAQAA